MNSIFIYLFTRLVDVKSITNMCLGWLINNADTAGELILLTGNLAIIWILLYYMYKKGIFFRI
jgi:hypothetical protein